MQCLQRHRPVDLGELAVLVDHLAVAHGHGHGVVLGALHNGVKGRRQLVEIGIGHLVPVDQHHVGALADLQGPQALAIGRGARAAHRGHAQHLRHGRHVLLDHARHAMGAQHELQLLQHVAVVVDAGLVEADRGVDALLLKVIERGHARAQAEVGRAVVADAALGGGEAIDVLFVQPHTVADRQSLVHQAEAVDVFECGALAAAPGIFLLVGGLDQVEYAWRRGKCTALEYIDRFGLVNQRLTIGHGVWLNEKDIDRLAAAKGCVCHNCSSNFRLRSGVAALNHFEKKGINTAIGLDEAGINDDRDMLQELKLVLRAHRVPGMVEEDVPTMSQVLRMATVGGARTTPYGESLGTLEVGKGADMVLIDWDKVAYPYLDELTPTLDAVVQRAKNDAVTMTMCDGEVIYKDGKFTKVDRTVALKALHDDLSKALSDDEVERRHLSKALLPHVRKFYAGYIDTSKHEPFYRPSSMV